MRKVAFDLDMALNNMAYTWELWMQQNFDPNFNLRQVKYFGYILDAYGTEADDYWRDPRAYDSILPLPGAVKLLETLGKDAFIITHTPLGQSSGRKDRWIKEHLGNIRVVHSGDKFLHSGGCVLVDDHPGHVQRHVRYNPHCHGIVFNHLDHYGWSEPLLQSDYVLRCTTYEEILTTLEELY